VEVRSGVVDSGVTGMFAPVAIGVGEPATASSAIDVVVPLAVL